MIKNYSFKPMVTLNAANTTSFEAMLRNIGRKVLFASLTAQLKEINGVFL